MGRGWAGVAGGGMFWRPTDNRRCGAGDVFVFVQWGEEWCPARSAQANRGRDVIRELPLLREIRTNAVFVRLTARRRRLPLALMLILACAIVLLSVAAALAPNTRSSITGALIFTFLACAAFLLISPLISGI